MAPEEHQNGRSRNGLRPFVICALHVREEPDQQDDDQQQGEQSTTDVRARLLWLPDAGRRAGPGIHRQ
jgi:hypothetical protein